MGNSSPCSSCGALAVLERCDNFADSCSAMLCSGCIAGSACKKCADAPDDEGEEEETPAPVGIKCDMTLACKPIPALSGDAVGNEESTLEGLRASTVLRAVFLFVGGWWWCPGMLNLEGSALEWDKHLVCQFEAIMNKSFPPKFKRAGDVFKDLVRSGELSNEKFIKARAGHPEVVAKITKLYPRFKQTPLWAFSLPLNQISLIVSEYSAYFAWPRKFAGDRVIVNGAHPRIRMFAQQMIRGTAATTRMTMMGAAFASWAKGKGSADKGVGSSRRQCHADDP
ncbi:hypothetical protein BC828DRAFT_376694 [Blastocladiella britannica]|nr:hypothetical protein BC828DRAFT_376694 [Blastocladiella britannica]